MLLCVFLLCSDRPSSDYRAAWGLRAAPRAGGRLDSPWSGVRGRLGHLGSPGGVTACMMGGMGRLSDLDIGGRPRVPHSSTRDQVMEGSQPGLFGGPKASKGMVKLEDQDGEELGSVWSLIRLTRMTRIQLRPITALPSLHSQIDTRHARVQTHFASLNLLYRL